jgi:methionine biosynthesis protein MetW
MFFIHKLWEGLRKPAPLQDFDDYDDYWKIRDEGNDLPPLMPRYCIIAELIPDGSTVLDIGCGSGAFLNYLSSKKNRCVLLGADISANATNRLAKSGISAKKLDPLIPLNLQFDTQFDYVVMMEVIEHIHDAEAVTRQAAKLTRNKLYITVPNVGFILHRIRLGLFGRFPVTNIRCHMKEHIRFWTVTDFKDWANYLGLTILRVIPQISDSEPALIRLLAKYNPDLFSKAVIYEIQPEMALSKNSEGLIKN